MTLSRRSLLAGAAVLAASSRARAAADARTLEPAVPATAALLSESTGIVDAIGYARALEAVARERGAATIVFGSSSVHEPSGAAGGGAG